MSVYEFECEPDLWCVCVEIPAGVSGDELKALIKAKLAETSLGQIVLEHADPWQAQVDI